MSPAVASLLFAVWLLSVGLLGVHFEVESVYCGTRVEALLEEETRLLDQLRRRDMKYNTMLSPDVLEAQLPEEYRFFNYPIPREEEEGTDEDPLARVPGSTSLDG